ncbi:hypothetical protein BU17DRAFT_60084 [Hysterangium stoloniferum]|nr:hypothetical protein BU17DRAFT_60084 [Hysterangium stoloniferum]
MSSWTLPMRYLNIVWWVWMGSWNTGSGVGDERGDHRRWHWVRGRTSTSTRVARRRCEMGNGCEGYGELFGAGTGAGEKGSGMVCAEGWKSVSEIGQSVSLAGETGSKTLQEYDGPEDDSTRQDMTSFLVHDKPNILLSAYTHNCPSPCPRQ